MILIFQSINLPDGQIESVFREKMDSGSGFQTTDWSYGKNVIKAGQFPDCVSISGLNGFVFDKILPIGLWTRVSIWSDSIIHPNKKAQIVSFLAILQWMPQYLVTCNAKVESKMTFKFYFTLNWKAWSTDLFFNYIKYLLFWSFNKFSFRY